MGTSYKYFLPAIKAPPPIKGAKVCMPRLSGVPSKPPSVLSAANFFPKSVPIEKPITAKISSATRLPNLPAFFALS